MFGDVSLRRRPAALDAAMVDALQRVGHAREFVVREALAGRADVTVVLDDALRGDDVLVSGTFAQVDLRRSAILAALDAVLADDAPLGPMAPPTGGTA